MFIRNSFSLNLIKILVLCLCLASVSLNAQNLAGVFGSRISSGSQGVEYRMGYTDDLGGNRNSFAHRFHYQRAVSDSLMFRGVFIQRKLQGDSLEFRAFRLETLIQVLDREQSGFDSTIRIDLQIAEGDNQPGFLRLGWGTQFSLSERLQFRTNLLAGRQIGSNSKSEIFTEIRFLLQYSLTETVGIGVESFSNLGFWNSFGSFDDQNHLLAPYLSLRIAERLNCRLQYVEGLSQSAVDHQFRIYIGYKL